MKLAFVLLAAALLACCAVDGRPQPGTTGGKPNDDLDGIGDDLADFLKHRDQVNNNHRETQNVYSNNRNTWAQQKPSGSRRGAAGALQPPALTVAALGALCVWLLAEARS